MRRRDFITLIGAAGAWPLAAPAQQPSVPVVGYLDAGSSVPGPFSAAFRHGLSESGFVEGRDVVIENRFAKGRYDRLPALAADLVRRKVNLIAACTTSAPGLAAKAATSLIPIVFQTGGGPVEDGLVASMNRPGGNITGVSRLSVALEPKRLEVLHELVPEAAVIAALVNPANARTERVVAEIEAAAGRLGLTLHVLKASSQGELEGAFASLAQLRAGALLVPQEPAYATKRSELLALASRYTIPAMYGNTGWTSAGGLTTYDASTAESFREVGVYVRADSQG
jgi:putative ABC transport system substrate-binding protein